MPVIGRELAVLGYSKLANDIFEIKSFKHVKSEQDIKDKYGARTLELYEQKRITMFRLDRGAIKIVHKAMHDEFGEYSYSMRVSTKLDKQAFEKLIQNMKTAGRNLVDSIREARKESIVKEIII